VKYSNLGTLAQWQVSCLEHSRPCCNLLDALVYSNLATWCPSWGKSPWVPTITTPCSSLPCHCITEVQFLSLQILFEIHRVFCSFYFIILIFTNLIQSPTIFLVTTLEIQDQLQISKATTPDFLWCF
jgi:hypothetical protein